MDHQALKASAAAAATDAAKLRSVPVPGWSEPIYIRPITVAESGLLEAIPETDPVRNARLLARMIRDEDGELIFDETNAEDLELLAKQSVAVYNAVAAPPAKDADPGNA